MKTMKNSEKGQTVIETALMIMLLLVLFFGIAEVARFWWLKNQINNAARVGVRVAIVDTNLTGSVGSPANPQLIGTCNYTSGNPGSCNASGASYAAAGAACNSITNGALCGGTGVYLVVQPDPDTGSFIPGGIVTVKVTSPPITSIVPGLASLSFGLIPNSIPLSSDSTMRHE